MMEGRAPVQSLTGINQGMGTHSLEALHKLEISLVAQMIKNLPTPVFLPGESQGQRSLVGNSPWGCKELDTAERLIL